PCSRHWGGLPSTRAADLAGGRAEDLPGPAGSVRVLGASRHSLVASAPRLPSGLIGSGWREHRPRRRAALRNGAYMLLHLHRARDALVAVVILVAAEAPEGDVARLVEPRTHARDALRELEVLVDVRERVVAPLGEHDLV